MVSGIEFTGDKKASDFMLMDDDKLRVYEEYWNSEKHEDLIHTMNVHHFDYPPTVKYGKNPVNYPIHNLNLEEKYKEYSGHDYVSNVQERLKHKVDVKNALKRDDIASKRPDAIKNIWEVKLTEGQLDKLPSEFSNIKYLMDDENLKKMEYFRKLNHKFVAKVEAPWENASQNYGQF